MLKVIYTNKKWKVIVNGRMTINSKSFEKKRKKSKEDQTN